MEIKDIVNKLNRDYIFSNIQIGLQKCSTENIEKKKSIFDGIEEYLFVRGEEYSMKVSKDLLNLMDINIETAWEKAKENTFAVTVVKSLKSVIDELFGVDTSEEDNATPIYVVTNIDRNRGASAALNREEMEKIAKKHRVKRLMVLPSSIHEMLVIPDDGSISLAYASMMVNDVNHTQVIPKERLTDKAYIIDF